MMRGANTWNITIRSKLTRTAGGLDQLDTFAVLGTYQTLT